jgi:hypothetical protein
MPDLNVPYIAQNFEFDCWYASLRMIVKFRNGPGAEPMGYETAELAGMTAQSSRDAKRVELVQSGMQPGSYGYRKELAKVPRRGLNANEFIPMAQRNGLVAPMMPGGGGFTYNQYDGLLSVHGPLWCAVGYGHIVVAERYGAGRPARARPARRCEPPLSSCEFQQFDCLGHAE